MSMVSVKIMYGGESRTIRVEGKHVEDAIKQSGISPQTVLAKLNGEFVPDDEKLKDGDNLELKRISSIG